MPRRAEATEREPTLNTVAPPVRIFDLMDRYASVVSHHDRDSINETTIRESFLNPLLEELGWDPRNRRGVPERDRDVILEDRLHIEGQQKAPDYALVGDGRRRLFIEAKRPSVSIAKSTSSSHQIRRYCWSAGLPLGILTNFEEVAVYDCRTIPKIEDGPAESRILYFKYSELPQYWGELDSLFGKQQVLNGSIDKYVLEKKAPRQSKPIDDAFLNEIRGWRTALAIDIAQNNPSLDVVDLNEVVQQLIDRLIFLRIAEARGLEPFEGLKDALKSGGNHYERLITIFKRANDRYNSGLFHLSENPDIPGPPDTLSTEVAVSDAPLERIINKMYYPQPYEFSVLPADILGRIYEQFLGEQIERDEDRHIVVELKPELRKSGGVYYTPEPVVKYIVENTIGALLKGKTPKDAEKLRIVDPACGSGSFLIAAYQYLMDWHRDYFADKVRLAKVNLEMGTDGTLRLRNPLRRKVLLNNIYGVDIDPQAVEVTKLSLLLKVIEGQNQLEFVVGRVLPDLDANIACGNSLIESDFEMPMNLTREEQLNFNPFDWTTKWPEIMSAGGFDAVIGNPPYLSIDKEWGRNDPRLAYIKRRYADVHSDKTDILFYFLRRGADICKGEISFIVSRSFLEADKARKLREWLGSNVRFREVLDFRHAIVFPKVGINTAIIRFTKSRAVKDTLFRRWIGRTLPPGYDEKVLADQTQTTQVTVPWPDLGSDPWNFGNPTVRALVERIDKAGDRLGDVLHIGQGMQTAANKVFELDLDDATYGELHQLGFAYKRARNSNIGKYSFIGKFPVVAFPNRARSANGLPRLIREKLKADEEKLKSRAAYKRGDCRWWAYSWPLHMEYIDHPRIMCPYMAAENRFAVDQECEYIGWTDTTVLYDDGQPEDLRYIAAILNSAPLTFRFRFLGKLIGGGVYEYFENTISKLPLPRSRPGEPAHDELVSLVERRLEASSELETTLLEDDRMVVEGVIRTIDDRVNDTVAKLFKLTDADMISVFETLDDTTDDDQ